MHIFQCLGEIFCVEFQKVLWNSTQNIWHILWKMWFYYNVENLRDRRFKSSFKTTKVHSSPGVVRCALRLQMTTPRLLPPTCPFPIPHQQTWPPTSKKRMTMADLIPRQHPKMQSCPRSPKPYHLPWIQHWMVTNRKNPGPYMVYIV